MSVVPLLPLSLHDNEIGGIRLASPFLAPPGSEWLPRKASMAALARVLSVTQLAWSFPSHDISCIECASYGGNVPQQHVHCHSFVFSLFVPRSSTGSRLSPISCFGFATLHQWTDRPSENLSRDHRIEHHSQTREVMATIHNYRASHLSRPYSGCVLPAKRFNLKRIPASYQCIIVAILVSVPFY